MDLEQQKALAAELSALDARVNAYLPPRYQHCYSSVSPVSMGSAGLKYAPDGRVAWDQVWTSFCDLALAGGPPHRGKLLEPVGVAEVEADQERYWDVVVEIERAIGQTTRLPTAGGYATGWVGVRCASPGEAAWLQFAVNAENVSARRRGAVLQVPAGPSFRVEKEIKSVVVALAKAHHYWDGHLTADQQALAGEDEWEPASPSEASADRAAYEASFAEIQGALRAAGRHPTPRRYVGWAGVQASDEEEAVWLLRAVLAGRVLARREGEFLYLPVGATPEAARAGRIGNAFSQACRLWGSYSSRLRAW